MVRKLVLAFFALSLFAAVSQAGDLVRGVRYKLSAGLDGVPAVIDTETMVRYGVSATPTFVLIDRKGLVRLYAPTRLSEAELSRRIDAVLAEAP
jgi:hypothetical protein